MSFKDFLEKHEPIPKNTNNPKIGDFVFINNHKFEVVDIEPIDHSLTHLIKTMEDTGKDVCYYTLSKISQKTGKRLKSGSGRFMRFTKSGKFLKI